MALTASVGCFFTSKSRFRALSQAEFWSTFVQNVIESDTPGLRNLDDRKTRSVDIPCQFPKFLFLRRAIARNRIQLAPGTIRFSLACEGT
jgi:hypothetical protein